MTRCRIACWRRRAGAGHYLQGRLPILIFADSRGQFYGAPLGRLVCSGSRMRAPHRPGHGIIAVCHFMFGALSTPLQCSRIIRACSFSRPNSRFVIDLKTAKALGLRRRFGQGRQGVWRFDNTDDGNPNHLSDVPCPLPRLGAWMICANSAPADARGPFATPRVKAVSNVRVGSTTLIDDVRVMSACPSTSDISLRCGER
jgi:hypothetical protein